MRSWYRIVKFALQSFWRNIWLSLITITMLTITLLMVNVLVIVHVVGETALRAVESKIDVAVSFVPTVSEGLVSDARGSMLSLPQVKDVKEFSAEEVLRQFRLENADKPEILAALDEVDGNPFGPELIITAHHSEDFPFILQSLDAPQYTSVIAKKDFQDHTTIIAGIHRTVNDLRIAGFVLGGIFLLIAILIIINTMRVALYTHREEIGIMRLVGASGFFIRAPFLVEAILYGVLATGVTFLVVYPTLGVLEPILDQFFSPVASHLQATIRHSGLWIFGGQFVAVTLVTMLTTAAAMRKYLRA